MRQHQLAVDAASLILGHSKLEEFANDALLVSDLRAPQDWQRRVEKQQIPLEQVMKKERADILREQVHLKRQ